MSAKIMRECLTSSLKRLGFLFSASKLIVNRIRAKVSSDNNHANVMDDIILANRYIRQVSIVTDLPYIDFLKRKFTCTFT